MPSWLLLVPLRRLDETDSQRMERRWKVQPTVAARMNGYCWGDANRNRKQTGRSKSLLPLASWKPCIPRIVRTYWKSCLQKKNVDCRVPTAALQSNIFRGVSTELPDNSLITNTLRNEVLDLCVTVAAGVTQICLQFGVTLIRGDCLPQRISSLLNP